MNLDPSFIVHWSLLSVLFCSLVSLVSLVLLWVHFHIKIWFFLWKWGFPYPIPSTFIKLNPFMWVYEFGCFFHSALTITICILLLPCPIIDAFPYKKLNFFWTGGFPYSIPSIFIKLNPFICVCEFGCFFHNALANFVLFYSLVPLGSLVLLWVHLHIKIWIFLWTWGFPYPIPSTFIKLNHFMCVYGFGCFFHNALAITICTLHLFLLMYHISLMSWPKRS